MRWLVLVGLIVAACRGEDAGTPPPDGDGFPYPPPRTDAFPAVGGPETFELAAWNIENFPANGRTPARVADLITSLDLDVVVCEEIASETAWRELVDRLRDYTAVLSEHRYTPTDYQKIGVLFRTSMVTLDGPPVLLFPASTYQFPRPPLSVHLAIDDGVHAPLAIEVIGVHLKAGVAVEDGDRRRLAVEDLDRHLRAQVLTGEDEVVIAGDYNEVLNTTVGQTNLAAFLGAPDLYTVRTQAAADAGEISFVPSLVLLDHLTTTAGLADELAGAQLVIPRLHTIPGYTSEVSDHLPIILVAPLAPR